MPTPIEHAMALAARLADEGQPSEGAGSGPGLAPISRHFVMGDPQAPIEKVMRILDRYGLLGGDGRLAPDAALITIGDHFDYEGDPDEVAENGFRLVRWLAAHPPERVVMIAGNHDLCRVMELARATDEEFAEAVRLAGEIGGLEASASQTVGSGDPPIATAGFPDGTRLEHARREFAERFPWIPGPDLARRDWVSFRVRQRRLVQNLLLAGRLRLAQAARMRNGRPLLLTHASITLDELDLLGIPGERNPATIADRLNDRLATAVSRVRDSWQRGEGAPLDLEPLHTTGSTGRIGEGILCMRPANPTPGRGFATTRGNPGGDSSRHYDPRLLLPRGLLQACGHTGHRKCLKVLGDWAMDSARGRTVGGLRTLRCDGARVTYVSGILPVPEGEAGLYMIDGEMNRVSPDEYSLLEIAGPS